MSGNTSESVELFFKGSGRFYSASYAYQQYYNYLNVMLVAVAKFLGIGKKKVIDSLKANKYNEFLHDLSFMDGTLRAFVGNDTHYIPVLWELCRG